MDTPPPPPSATSGAPPRSWISLDLHKAAALIKEVDEVVKLYTRAHSEPTEGPRAVASWRQSIEARISQLEEFYSENEQDKRAFLFEKQRLRLRRMLQASADNHERGKASTSSSRPQPSRTQFLSTTGNSSTTTTTTEPTITTTTTMRRRRSRRTTTTTDKYSLILVGLFIPLPFFFCYYYYYDSHHHHHKQGSDTAKNISNGNHSNSKGSKAQWESSKGPGTFKFRPIYKWELPLDHQMAEEEDKGPINTDYGTYLPGEPRGYYLKEDYQADPSTYNATLDFQIVLTEGEYRTLQARRRGSSKYQSDSKSSESLLTSTPYLDPWRVEEAMYRPPMRGQWVTPDGFKLATTATK